MENLIFSLNATMPVFFMMILGFLLHQKTRLLSDSFADALNIFVFKVALPVQLFENLATSDFRTLWNGGVVAFCFLVSLVSILLLVGLSLLLRERSLRAEFVQAGYRGSQALLGAALMQNIYGGTGPLALVLIGAVPLYNVAAVMLLTLLGPDGHLDRKSIGKSVRGIVTNPIILGIAVGLVWSLLRIPQPVILQRGVSSLAATATPMGLLALGASIDPKKAAGCWKPTAVCSAFKLVIFAALFLPVAVYLGYRGEILVVILIMLASPSTVSCFSMARSMGHEGVLSSSAVMLTTILSGFSFTFWLYLLKSLALI
ncbi:AEC family transporter [Oscillibacter sp.]|uniref:AEC family transporter n=1 Tax=Oscillibacter sp. TaxID=1945593 RepID=UPI002623077A|nr:AEC family transporter [Oscillibacter sp.]MDD3346070.1 AEC family transporter [Oscillibacter sp.]